MKKNKLNDQVAVTLTELMQIVSSGTYNIKGGSITPVSTVLAQAEQLLADLVAGNLEIREVKDETE